MNMLTRMERGKSQGKIWKGNDTAQGGMDLHLKKKREFFGERRDYPKVSERKEGKRKKRGIKGPKVWIIRLKTTTRDGNNI